jgi:tripartite ATP-independent transporter DctM subunit
MGPIIPPSVPMIIAATMTGLSVSKMFMAGIVPGILMGGGMCFVCWYESKKHNYPKRDRMSTFKEIVHEGKEAIWAIIMVAIILFGIMGGVMTPTEASIVCIAYGTIVSFVVYRKLNLKSFYLCLKTTLSSSAAIMALVAFANVFAYILTKERIPNMIADAMLGLTSNKYIILLLINLFLIFVGMFMETIAAILILFPVLLQLATAVGVDPVQFGIIVVMNLVLGLCTPPVGVCLFAATSIGDKTSKDLGGPGNKLSENVVALIPFMISNFTVLALTTYVPALTVGVANLITGR